MEYLEQFLILQLVILHKFMVQRVILSLKFNVNILEGWKVFFLASSACFGGMLFGWGKMMFPLHQD
jgi:hypothetical protein